MRSPSIRVRLAAAGVQADMRFTQATVFALALAAAASCGHSALPEVDAGPDLERRLRAFTGPEPVDCGERRDLRPTSRAPVSAAESLACAQRATASRRSFRVILGSASADCWNARGWVGSDEGLLHEFAYVRCAIDGRTTFEVRRCGEIAGRPSANAGFTCVPPRETLLADQPPSTAVSPTSSTLKSSGGTPAAARASASKRAGASKPSSASRK